MIDFSALQKDLHRVIDKHDPDGELRYLYSQNPFFDLLFNGTPNQVALLVDKLRDDNEGYLRAMFSKQSS